jgi:hypothetical protein
MTAARPPPKKDIETIYFERFCSAFGEFPVGRIEPTEEPDFLIHRQGSVLGVEITELHREPKSGQRPIQADEAMRKRVVARAQEIYQAGGHLPVNVSAFLNDAIRIEKSDVEPLAAALCDIVARNVPGPNSTREEQYVWTNRSYFPEVLNSVSVHRLDVITKSFFSCPGTIWVDNLTPTDVERSLALKESKYAAYRRQCDEAWLVINADLGSMSTWFEVDERRLSIPYQTKFDRLFVYLHFSAKVIELPTRR